MKGIKQWIAAVMAVLTILCLSACEEETLWGTGTPPELTVDPSDYIQLPSAELPDISDPLPTKPLPTDPLPTQPLPTDPLPTIPTKPVDPYADLPEYTGDYIASNGILWLDRENAIDIASGEPVPVVSKTVNLDLGSGVLFELAYSYC